MAATKRIERLQIRIKEELAQIITKEFDFNPGVLVTVTRSEVSDDLTAVRIYLSVYPEKETEGILDILQKQIYFIQQIFNKRMEMRPVPRIRFVLDESVREADKIERSLYDLKNKA
ncbi:MAG: ribosome-binding factor A [Candidatus Terrybacteria bacterium RIFCSPLOWO2_01_FULL_44_24]|uniref:Ribosome-binding factor A n=1 Tax=Candidatus Terrybacteria bacterium RIFCSPHIGHO2_01_FULL_43_35 TaxID=1802361 RepID=A0A1G2PEW5_9BACT|nr:MAG: ribosome-binding factor A [Candidatus Terrybacteria bacterium RIFCSPHIGHO2_01_FULL_43_35]OHA50233.1 MAG: ribosome-binding factor A [Candidatus Terrybacteria bacterium RIFCSPHIGHO2_02_FULL_43_14]OHA51016.1 MAG: ribosome-binding factor A [Candidatus Terrybacteria bacterium RIFCSPLOWO2_01_FULL_44_24]